MRVVWHLVRKDLRRRMRSPLAPLLVLAFPLVFAGLLAATFGSDNEPRQPRIDLYVEDLDDSVVSRALLSVLQSEQASANLSVSRIAAGADNPIEDGRGTALLRIPEAFGQDLLAGRPVRLELIKNPAQGILSAAAEQGSHVLAELLSAASFALREPLDQLGEWTTKDDAEPSEAQVLGLTASIYAAVESAEVFVLPPALTLETGTNSADDDEDSVSGFGSVFLFILPGISVWALFLVGDIGMRELMTEGNTGTLRRQLSSPLSPHRLLVAKAVYTGVLALGSLVLLSVIGAVFVSAPIDLLGYGVLSAALVLAIVGFAAAIYSISATERQGATLSSILILASAAVVVTRSRWPVCS